MKPSTQAVGVMSRRCKNCNDGLITLLGTTKRIVTCVCPRGREREAEQVQADAESKLKAALLAAFYETGKKS